MESPRTLPHRRTKSPGHFSLNPTSAIAVIFPIAPIAIYIYISCYPPFTVGLLRGSSDFVHDDLQPHVRIPLLWVLRTPRHTESGWPRLLCPTIDQRTEGENKHVQ